MSSPINYICNEMLVWAVFPDRLKYAIIKPLHKNDDVMYLKIDLVHS
jgi:hypothetical protein